MRLEATGKDFEDEPEAELLTMTGRECGTQEGVSRRAHSFFLLICTYRRLNGGGGHWHWEAAGKGCREAN